jgi:uncharacterized membrane protein YcaP (DUF421 family)
MEILHDLFGREENLNTFQMCIRAVCIFFITLLLIRISGRRSFGMRSPFDNVIVILLGAVLGRTVVGASPMVPTIAAALVIVLMHRGVAWLSLKYKWLSYITKGTKLVLYKDGKILKENMDRALVSEEDLKETIRNKIQQDGYHEIEQANMERCGEISILKRQKNKVATRQENQN